MLVNFTDTLRKGMNPPRPLIPTNLWMSFILIKYQLSSKRLLYFLSEYKEIRNIPTKLCNSMKSVQNHDNVAVNNKKKKRLCYIELLFNVLSQFFYLYCKKIVSNELYRTSDII